MPQSRSIIDRWTVLSSGHVEVKILKQVTEGENVLFSEPHRCVIDPETDAEAMSAHVDGHLISMGFPAVAKDEWERVFAHVIIARAK